MSKTAAHYRVFTFTVSRGGSNLQNTTEVLDEERTAERMGTTAEKLQRIAEIHGYAANGKLYAANGKLIAVPLAPDEQRIAARIAVPLAPDKQRIAARIDALADALTEQGTGR